MAVLGPTADRSPEEHMSNAQPVTDAQWENEVLKSDTPVLVDFWAEWCGPCRMVGPVVEEIAGEKAGSLKVLKLNVDDNPETARAYKVMSIPTLMVFKDGQEAKRIVGAKGKEQLLNEVEPFLA
jgi:thioredoxin 1